MKQESEYQKLLMQRYGDEPDQVTLKYVRLDPADYGYEEDMLEWLKSHPDASFQELVAFDFSHYEPVEIVDDDDLDEYDEYDGED